MILFKVQSNKPLLFLVIDRGRHEATTKDGNLVLKMEQVTNVLDNHNMTYRSGMVSYERMNVFFRVLNSATRSKHGA